MKTGRAIDASPGDSPDRDDREARVRFSIGGMSCANCAFSVEKALKNVPGVKSAVVNAAAALALPILLIHHGIAPVPNGPFVLLLLGTILQFTAGFRFYRGAWYPLRSGHANMDVLEAEE